jgi:hypothetical protein
VSDRWAWTERSKPSGKRVKPAPRPDENIRGTQPVPHPFHGTAEANAFALTDLARPRKTLVLFLFLKRPQSRFRHCAASSTANFFHPRLDTPPALKFPPIRKGNGFLPPEFLGEPPGANRADDSCFHRRIMPIHQFTIPSARPPRCRTFMIAGNLQEKSYS